MTTLAPDSAIACKFIAGIRRDIGAAEYHVIDACRASALNALRRSPAHCRAMLDSPEDSETLLLGSATHCAVLEPAQFDRRYCFAPECDRRTKEGKALYADAELAASREGRILLPAKHREQIEGMAAAVLAHPSARMLVERVAEVELPIFWSDLHGEPCKAMLDGWIPDPGVVVDLKTTQDASPEAFARSVINYGYHRQAAWYLRGARAVGLPATQHVVVAVEKSAPHAVACYRLPEFLLDAASRELPDLVEQYRVCRLADRWPGYADEIVDLALPDWAIRRLEDGGAL